MKKSEADELLRGLGFRLSVARNAKGLKQVEVARLIGKGQTTYSAYERGTAIPSIITIRELSILYEVNEAWLLGLPEGNGKGPV